MGRVIGGALLYLQGQLVLRLWQADRPTSTIMLALATSALALGAAFWVALYLTAESFMQRATPP